MKCQLLGRIHPNSPKKRWASSGPGRPMHLTAFHDFALFRNQFHVTCRQMASFRRATYISFSKRINFAVSSSSAQPSKSRASAACYDVALRKCLTSPLSPLQLMREAGYCTGLIH